MSGECIFNCQGDRYCNRRRILTGQRTIEYLRILFPERDYDGLLVPVVGDLLKQPSKVDGTTCTATTVDGQPIPSNQELCDGYYSSMEASGKEQLTYTTVPDVIGIIAQFISNGDLT